MIHQGGTGFTGTNRTYRTERLLCAHWLLCHTGWRNNKRTTQRAHKRSKRVTMAGPQLSFAKCIRTDFVSSGTDGVSSSTMITIHAITSSHRRELLTYPMSSTVTQIHKIFSQRQKRKASRLSTRRPWFISFMTCAGYPTMQASLLVELWHCAS